MGSCIKVAHASGARLDPLAAGQAEAIDLLCGMDGEAAGRYDHPTELAAIVLSRDLAGAIHTLACTGSYSNASDVVSTALAALQWAESHPEGKRV